MSEVTESLLQELLDEPITVAIYGGGFKPPTKGHFTVVEKALSDFPEIDEFKIFVGGGVRDGITQEESIKIWDIYKKYLSDKIDVEPSVAPVKSVLGYAKDHPEEKIYWILGAREGDEEDLKDIESRTKSLDKYPNIEVKVITTAGGVSGTKTRAAIKSDNKEQFLHLIPNVDPREQEQIWDILKPVVKEEKEEVTEVGEANLKPYKWKEVDREGYFVYTRFVTDSETQYDVDLESMPYFPEDSDSYIQALGVEFSAKLKDAEGSSAKIVVNKGEMYRVMATLVDIIKKYIKKLKAKAILYSPSKKQGEEFGTQRDQLYKAFISKAIPGVKFEQDGELVAAILPDTVKETVTATKIICDNCGWSWDKKDGGKDLYICHKCGHDNTPTKSDPFGLNELARKIGEEMGRDLTKTWNPKKDFLSLSVFMRDNGMNITPLPKIKVIKDDKQNASDLLGKTAYYNPTDKSITLYTYGRHPKDILRSFAHEMVHHEQNLDGRLGNITTTNTNEDGHLVELEKEAYLKGNMMLRNWEDGIKNV